MESLTHEAENAVYHNNTRELYNTIKKIAGKFNKPERPVRDREGKLIPDEEGQKKRWAEHFQELLNRPAPQCTQEIKPAEIDLPIDCSPPRKEEVSQAIKQLKKGKAAGPDGIPAEALTADIETSY